MTDSPEECEARAGWNVGTLYIHFNSKFKAADDAVKLAKEAADEAKGKVSVAQIISIIALALAIASYYK